MKRILALLLLVAPLVASAQQRFLGGDISLLPSYREAGTAYRDSAGRRIDVLGYARRWGWNMVRVRLFVDPAHASAQARGEGVCQDLPYVIRLCRAAKKNKLGILLDVHYSNTWGDPHHQTMPERWKGLEIFALRDSVYQYTFHVLSALKKARVAPEMIQVGNEITYGMLWPVGKVDPCSDANWPAFASLLRAGIRACRDVCPEAKIVIHTEHAQDWTATRSFYDHLRSQKIDYDIIGLSYYPMWHGTIAHLGVVVDSLEACFHRPVIIAEAAAYYSHERDRWADAAATEEGGYTVSPEGQRQFTADLVDELNAHTAVAGLFWWFPEENESGRPVIDSWLNRGLFSNHTGRALPSWYELYRFRRAFTPIAKAPVRQKQHEQYSLTTLIIYYNAEVGKKPLLRAAKKIGAEIIYQYSFITGISVKKPQNMTLEETKSYFERVKGVASVQYDRIYHVD